MLAPPQRKRPRSPSPPPQPESITSPLDLILKRRRGNIHAHPDISPLHHHHHNSVGYFGPYPQPDIFQSQPETPDTEPESSTAPWNRFVERRRTRQWEKLNAPQSSSQSSSSLMQSQPPPPPSLAFDSPPHHNLHAQPQSHQMSSSPIRHHPPSSSPFRAYNSEDTRVERMDEDVMRREWGEEYAAQNSLLHSLHMARIHHGNMSTPGPTPDHTLLQTPSMPTPPIPTSYRSHSHHIPSSSPFNSHISHTGLQYTPGREDDFMDMEMLLDSGGTEGEDEIKRRYEETNRLLAELEVVRRHRWGEGQ